MTTKTTDPRFTSFDCAACALEAQTAIDKREAAALLRAFRPSTAVVDRIVYTKKAR